MANFSDNDQSDSDGNGSKKPGFSRRSFLLGGLASGGAVIGAAVLRSRSTDEATVPAGLAATPSTSTSTTALTVETPTSTSASTTDTMTEVEPSRLVGDGEHFPDGFTVPAGEVWALDEGAKVTTAGNVVVEGTLRLHQPDPERTMSLTFVDVDESAFQGGGSHEVLPTDVGLWVVNDGRLDVEGAPKTSWTRLIGAATAGETVISVEDAAGWRPGDELVVTATAPRSVDGHWKQSDGVRVASVDGERIELDQPLTYDHPVVAEQWSAEVINLTRSVVVEGTPDHKAHVIYLHQGAAASPGFGPADLKYLELRHLGPNRSNDRGEASAVLSRYALHFHHGAASTEGMTVEGVVVHNCGSHAFVPHASHGIEFRDCASHETLGDAYWWDPGDASNFVTYDRCIASNVKRDGSERFKTNGFFAARSTEDLSCAMRGCVATGVEGPDSAGFFWDNGSVGVWEFADCLAHNVQHNGIRVWQNTALVHPIERFSAFSCKVGVSHGAYANPYQYHGGRLHDCRTGLFVSAVTKAKDGVSLQEFHDITVTDCELPLHLADGPVDAHRRTEFRRCTFDQAVLEASHSDSAKHWDFVDCGLTPANFDVEQTQGEIVLRLQSAGEAWELEDRGRWASIAPFA